MDYYNSDTVTNGLIDAKRQKGALKEYQKVVAVGDSVRGINVGDMVCINPTRYGKPKHKEGSLKDGIVQDNVIVTYNFNVLELDNVRHLLLYDQDIDYVITEYEEVEDPVPSKLIHPNTEIII